MESAAIDGNEDKKMATKKYATHFIMSVLITSAVSYGGFAMLHHVQSDYGPAILARKGAIIVFTVADAITLILSVFSTLLAFRCWWNVKRNGTLEKSQKMAVSYYAVTMLAMIGMFLAYTSGTYALYGIKLLAAVQMVVFWSFCRMAISLT